MGDRSPRTSGGFKSFLSSDKGVERHRKKQLESIRNSLERGSYLSAPKTDVDGREMPLEGEFKGCAAVTASMQGWRVANEDASVLQVLTRADGSQCVYMGVYDGHGGREVAAYLADVLHTRIVQLPNLDEASLRSVFIEVDADMRKALGSSAGTTGATCSAVVLTTSYIICANTGDCRALLRRGGEVVPLSVDHSPEAASEKARVEAAGSEVKNGRIEGMLNVSRAFGDFDLKKVELAADSQAITCVCDVSITARSHDDEFIVQACDGIWTSLSDAECTSMLCADGPPTPPLLPRVMQLFKRVLAPTVEGVGTDNMTLNLVTLKKT